MATDRRSPHGRPYCENAEYAGFVRRVLRGLGRRAHRDIDVLPLLGALQAELDVVAVDAIVGALNDGHSWQDIGDRLGVTKQAVHLRYAAKAVVRQAELDAEAVTMAPAEPAPELPRLVPIDLAVQTAPQRGTA